MAQRRRAARNGKPVHRIVPLDIFERDGWVCHLCAEPIDFTLRGKEPGAPALDHIIPVTHPDYPGHIAANVAASHWVCNVSKGNRVTPEDYALHERLLAELPPGVPAKRHSWMGPGPRTHCINGHEFTPENTYLRPDRGGRVCRQCYRVRNRGYKAAKSRPKVERTHCPRGHEYTEENTYIPPGRSTKQCRTCMRAAGRAFDARKRGAPRARSAEHCDRGHAWTPENTYNPPGQPTKRICRECRRLRKRGLHRARQLEMFAAACDSIGPLPGCGRATGTTAERRAGRSSP